jgi:hypothetical protein
MTEVRADPTVNNAMWWAARSLGLGMAEPDAAPLEAPRLPRRECSFGAVNSCTRC